MTYSLKVLDCVEIILNYIRIGKQLNMQIAAKIKILLEESNIVKAQDLYQQFGQAKTKQGFINFGMAHPEQVICSFRGTNKKTQALTFGTLVMKDLINLHRQSDIQIQSIIPYAIFASNMSYQDVLKQRIQNTSEKIGTIMPRKLISKQVQKTDAKMNIKKKASQKTIVNKEEKQKQVQKQKKKDGEKQKNIKQIANAEAQKNQTNIYISQERKQETKIKTVVQLNKKSLKVESDSEDKILQQFLIEEPAKNEEQNKRDLGERIATNVESQGEAYKKQIEEKVADLDLDDDDAFELMMQKHKAKQQVKIQNQNVNIPEKKDKKTTEKTQITNMQKPKAVQIVQKPAQKPGGGQLQLDKFFTKKVSRD